MATTRTTPPAKNRGWRPERPRHAAIQRPRSRAAQLRQHSSAALIVGALTLVSAPASAQMWRLKPALAEGNAATDTASLMSPHTERNEFLSDLFPSPSDDEADVPGDPVYLAQAGLSYPGMGAGNVFGYPSPTPTIPGTARPGAQTGIRQPPFVAAVRLTETLTNNVNLASGEQRESDLVTELVPQLTVSEKGAHASLSGFIAAPILIYARTGARNNTIYPNVDLLGNVEAVEHFFFVEGSVVVTQKLFSPFGAQPADLANKIANRYTSEAYRVTPYIKGTAEGDIKYELRNNNVWTNFSSTPVPTNNAYYNQWLGNIASPISPYGWAINYERDAVTFEGQSPLVTQIGRGRLLAQVDPQLQVSAVGGYEDNHYTLADYRGPVYGAGLRWNPTPRAKLVANWEHRFFGPSYLFTFQNHGPLSVVDVHVSREITSYPQQFLDLPATADVPALLDSLFSSSIPDPAERQAFVDNLIQNRGLPTSLASPLNLYTEQINLQEDASVTLGVLGARNTVLMTGYYLRTEPITGAGTPLPPPLLALAGNNTTQKGVAVTWTHSLTPLITLVARATALRTTLNVPPFAKTTQGHVSLMATAPVSATTTVFAGARYQKSNSDLSTNYTEAGIFAGFIHAFR